MDDAIGSCTFPIVTGLENDEQKQNRWDTRYIKLARHIASWSKDPKARVGAVIANPDKGRIIALGFNGFPVKVEDTAERLGNGELKRKMVVHAEQNALLFAGQIAKGCVIYVVGKPVCERCAVLIIQAGITRVVARHWHTLPSDSKWLEGSKLALSMFNEAGVKFSQSGAEDADAIEGDGLSTINGVLASKQET